MGWFTPKQEDPRVEEIKKLTETVARLEGQIKALRAERSDLGNIIQLEDRITELQKEKTAKEIEIDKINERNARERRETEHLVGLQQRRADFEKEAAKREAELAVREENLAHEKEQFAEQMKFTTERFEKTEQNIMNILGQVMERLPKVEVGHQTRVTGKS